MMVLPPQCSDVIALATDLKPIRITHDAYREIKVHSLTYSMAHGRGYKKESNSNPSEEKTRNLEDTIMGQLNVRSTQGAKPSSMVRYEG